MTIQPLLAEDAPAVAAMRQAALAHKGEKLGPEARPMFDAMFAATPAAANVRVEAAIVGGIAGFWLRPANSTAGACMLYLHGGGYVLGSAQALTNFAGQIAARVGVDAFVPDYRLAPEHPFPAAIDDAVAVYHGLIADGSERIVVAGVSPFREVTLLSTATRALVGVMAEQNIRRLVCITGLGAGDSRGHGGFFFDRLFLPLLLRKVYEDKNRQEDAIRSSTLDWTIVRPTVLNDRPARGHIKALTDLSGVHGGTIARADVAEFVVQQLATDAWLRKAPLISW
jgi:hypothetical protein